MGSATISNDIGALWENFVFMELLKRSVLKDSVDTYYFWRTHTGQEIDIVKESGSAIAAIECKWSDGTTRAPSLWKDAYPKAQLTTITSENYLDYLLAG